jgi:hypothetical protein
VANNDWEDDESERDDPNEVRRFRAEVDLFQSWAGIEARRRRQMQIEWIAIAVVMVFLYVVAGALGQKQVTWLDICAGVLLAGVTIGMVVYEGVCAAALSRLAEFASTDGTGSASPVGRPAPDGNVIPGGLA